MSGYVEVNVGEDVMAFKFGTNAYALFCELHKIELYQVGESGVFGTWEGKNMVKPPDIIKMRDLFHCAYVANCRAKSIPVKYNLYEFGDILDEDNTLMLRLQETMVTSKMFGFNLKELGGDAAGENFPVEDQLGDS